MMTSPNIPSLTSMYDSYIRAGFALVPIRQGKGPVGKGWNLRPNVIRSSDHIDPTCGYGIAHAYSTPTTCALDIDAWADAETLLANSGVNLVDLAHAPDSVMIDSGNPGHAKFLFALPFGLVLASKKIVTNGRTIYEMRCATSSGLTVQDVLPSAVLHPKTGQPYRWAGQGHFSKLPLIPQALLDLWRQSIATDDQHVLQIDDTSPASWTEVKDALEHIPAECSRDEWINVGMALHFAGAVSADLDMALALWNDWSKTSKTNYCGERDIVTQWRSFRVDKSSTVKLGTLFKIARHYGYTRPIPDASDLFSQVSSQEVTPPDDLLMTLRPPAPEMQMDLWPQVLRDRANQLATQIGCDPLVPLFAGLAAISGVADAQMRLELVSGFNVPPVLWVMTIGDPAQKKSPASKPMLHVLGKLENEALPEFHQRLLDWEAKEAAYAGAKKAFLNFAASPGALLGEQAPDVPDLPPQPVPLRLRVSDITSQKLVRYAAERPRGLLCYLDEMNSWVRKLTDKSSGEDRSTWVVSYEADSYEMDRVGAGSVHCDNLAVSIYGNIQPQVFRETFKPLASDGLLQRFIMAPLRVRKWGRGEPIPEHLSNHQAWENTVRLVFALPPQQYRLSPDAYQMFRDFQLWYEDAKYDEQILNSSPEYMTAFGKLEGTLGRLVFIMHLIEAPFSIEVSASIMERAIRILKGYIIPSFRYVMGELSGTVNDSFDLWLTEHIIRLSNDSETISMPEIRSSARIRLEGKPSWQADRLIMDSMTSLEVAKWVIRVGDNPMDRTVWMINPKIADMFKVYRRNVLRADQRKRDYSYEIAKKRYPDLPRTHFKIREYTPDLDDPE